MLIPRTAFDAFKSADTESSRYALGAVKIERDDNTGEPLAIATDGRRMVVLGWKERDAATMPDGLLPEGFDASPMPAGDNGQYSALIPVDACKKAARFKVHARTVKARPILDNVTIDERATNGKVPMSHSNGETCEQLAPPQIEGRFPRWRDVCPSFQESRSFAVDAKYLAELAELIAKHAHAAASEPSRRVVLTFNVGEEGHNSPLVITAADDETGNRGYGVIMPLGTGQAWNKNPPPVQEWNPITVKPKAKKATAAA